MKQIKKRKKRRNIKTILFMVSVLFWPVCCFVFTNIILNINSFVLAFANYVPETDTFVYNAGFDNFIKLFKDLGTVQEFRYMIINSVASLVISVLFVPIPILVSYMVYKKCLFSKFFTVMLFLPSIISSIIWVLAYKYIMDYVIPQFFNVNTPGGVSLLYSDKAFMWLVVYSLFIGFAGGLVLYTGAMARIPKELIESGQLEGLNAFQELRYIVLPLIYPTLSVLLLGLPAGLFTWSPNTFAFYGADAQANTWTFGYYFFSILLGSTGTAKKEMYSYASASGLIFTLLVAPITFLFKRFLDKLDPEVEI